MNLEDIETGVAGTSCGIAVKFDQTRNFIRRECAWNRAGIREGYGGRRDVNQIGKISVASGMADLGACFCAKAMKQLNQRFQATNVFIAPDAEVAWADTAVSVDSQCFWKNQPCLTQRASAVMNAMPVRDEAIVRCHVHAHRGHDNAVFKCEAFDCVGGQQQAHLADSIVVNME
jgi:hypothetical protein